MSEEPVYRPPPQFGLRTMLAFMAGASLLFGISNWFGPGLAVGLAFFVLLALVHVAANKWGGRHFDPRLQDSPRPQHNIPPEFASPEAARETLTQMRAETTERIGRIRLGWLTVLATVLGAVAGGFAGHAMGEACFDLRKANATNGLIVAALSAGVLGGFLGFWCSSFLQIFCAMNAAGWEGARRKTPVRPASVQRPDAP